MSSKKAQSSKEDSKEAETRCQIKVAERPTFILKTREGESRAVSPSQRNGAKKENENPATGSSLPKQVDKKLVLNSCPEMTTRIKFMDEGMQLCESCLDYLQDQQDFLVVGVLGPQGVGKSTVMSLLTENYAEDCFPVQSFSNHESGCNCTVGIDMFVTKNRVIYLDTQPILSSAMVETLSSITFEQKKGVDFVNTDVNLELQSLQFTAFLFSVCHVIIFVQDWFVDANLVRFLQTAEMLKPASTTTMDQDYVEYYPHLLFLHNKATLQDFLPSSLERMKNFYNKAFATSRLQTHSGLDMSANSVDGQLNLFLLPNVLCQEETAFCESQSDLIERLKRKIHGVARNAMTPSTLSEKNWFHYVTKVIEAIKKSHLSSEYGRLMP